MEEKQGFYTKGEEIANAITHGVGTLLAISALIILTIFACIYGDTYYVVSYIIFGVSLIILYLGSTLYHSIVNKRAKAVLRILDHSSIYILIAGTYTPFSLTILRPYGGYMIFLAMWIFAAVGIVMKVFWLGKFEKLETFFYVLMGWAIILKINKLFVLMPRISFVFLVLGGVSYTAGSLLFLKDDIPYNHAYWHMFVLAGSIFHFFSLLFCILP